MEQKKLKIVTLLITAFLLTTSAGSASSRAACVTQQSYTGTTASVERHTKNTICSVTDGKYTFSLERALAAPDRAVFIYSIEAVTVAAETELMSRSFEGSVSLRQPEGGKIKFDLMTQNEIEELRTGSKRYFSCFVEGLDNPWELPLAFHPDIMTDRGKYIEIAIDTDPQSLALSLSDPSGGDTFIRLSSVDILVEKDAAGFGDKGRCTDIHFRMGDGSLKAFGELFLWQCASLTRDKVCSDSDNPLRYRHSAIVRGAVDLQDIKGIIVGDLEYDLTDPSKGYAVQPE